MNKCSCLLKIRRIQITTASGRNINYNYRPIILERNEIVHLYLTYSTPFSVSRNIKAKVCNIMMFELSLKKLFLFFFLFNCFEQSVHLDVNFMYDIFSKQSDESKNFSHKKLNCVLVFGFRILRSSVLVANILWLESRLCEIFSL